MGNGHGKTDCTVEKRLKIYLHILKKNPAAYESVKKCMEDMSGLSDMQKLYLHSFSPILVDFCEWLIEEATRNGKERLYFLARDAYTPYLITKALCKARKISLECRYLKVSRYSLRMALYHRMGEECTEYICLGGIGVTFEKVMKRCGLSEEEALYIAEKTGYKAQYKKVLEYEEIQRLKGTLRNEREFLENVYAHSMETYPKTIGYLEQEGMLEDISYGIVDSGWVGTMQKVLEDLIQSIGQTQFPRLEGYYFGLYDVPKGVERKNYHCYYFAPDKQIKRKVYFSNCLFEAVCSSPEGMALGYEDVNGLYEVIQGKCNPNSALLKMNQDILMAYVEKYLSINGRAGDKKLSFKILRLIMGEPSREEAARFGEYLFCDDVREDDMQKVANTLTEKEIKEQRFSQKVGHLFGNNSHSKSAKSAWLEGSIVNNGINVKTNLRHAAMYKYALYVGNSLKKK